MEIKDIFVNKVEILLREKMSSNSDTNIDGMYSILNYLLKKLMNH